VCVFVKNERVLRRENLWALIAGKSLDLVVNCLLVVLQRSVGSELDVANVADGFELVVIKIVCYPLFFASVVAIADLAGHAGGSLFKVLVGCFSRVAFQTFFVLLEMIVACESLVTVSASDVRQVVEVKDVLV
jgi:hypothetical protein